MVGEPETRTDYREFTIEIRVSKQDSWALTEFDKMRLSGVKEFSLFGGRSGRFRIAKCTFEIAREAQTLFRPLKKSAGNPVVPAERILVKKAPEIAETSRNCRQKRGEHTPAAPAAAYWAPLEIREL